MLRFDPKLITAIVDGRVLTGFAEDSFIKCEKLEDNFTEHVGGQGEVSVAINANETGEVTFTFANTSPSIAYLNQLANSKKEVPISIIDMNTNGTNVSGTKAMVRKPADIEWGKEVGEVEMKVFIADYKVE